MIRPSDILLVVGAPALATTGTITRTTAPISRRGEEGKEVWTRASTGLYRSRSGLYLSAGVDVPRIEMLDLNGDGSLETPAVLAEGAATNLVENGDYETDAVGSLLRGGSTIARDSTNVIKGSWALKVTTANANESGVEFQTRAGGRIVVSATTAYAISAWVYAPAASVGKSLRYSLSWYTGGGASISTSLGSTVVLVAGWQRCTLAVTSPGTAATVESSFWTVGAQGVFDFWADLVQLEANGAASSPIPTTTAAVTRSADVASMPWVASPQAMTCYAKFVERGTLTSPSVATVFNIGQDGAQFDIFVTAAGGFYRGRYFFSGSSGVVSDLAVAPVYGDTVELMAVLFADGSVQLSQSINGAALTSGARSAGLGLVTTWNSQLLVLNDNNGSHKGFLPLVALIVARGAPSLADFRELIPSFA